MSWDSRRGHVKDAPAMGRDVGLPLYPGVVSPVPLRLGPGAVLPLPRAVTVSLRRKCPPGSA